MPFCALGLCTAGPAPSSNVPATSTFSPAGPWLPSVPATSPSVLPSSGALPPVAVAPSSTVASSTAAAIGPPPIAAMPPPAPAAEKGQPPVLKPSGMGPPGVGPPPGGDGGAGKPEDTKPTPPKPEPKLDPSEPDDKRTSSACDRSITASICTTSLFYVAPTLSNPAASTSTSTSTTCSTTVGCSVVDRTATVKSTASAAVSSCAPITIPITIIDDDEVPDDATDGTDDDQATDLQLNRRSVITNGTRSFVRRGGQEIKLSPPKKWQARDLAKFQPGQNPGGPAYMWLTTIKKNDDDCDGIPWDIRQVEDSKIITTEDAAGRTYIHEGDGPQSDASAGVNVDHVYESKILRYFFSDDAPSEEHDPDFNDPNTACNQWRKFWVHDVNTESKNYPMGGPGAQTMAKWFRMTTILRLLPGGTEPRWADFVGMDKNINGMKGTLFERDMRNLDPQPDRPSKLPADWMMDLNLLGLAQRVMRLKEVASRFRTANARIYGGFQRIDGIKGDCGPPPHPNYASKYSTWMENYLQTQGAAVTSAWSSIVETHLPASTLTTTLKDKDGKSTGEDTHLADRLHALTAAYPTQSLTFDTAALLTWPAQPDPAQAFPSIAKRDGSATAAPACAASATDAQATAGPPTSAPPSPPSPPPSSRTLGPASSVPPPPPPEPSPTDHCNYQYALFFDEFSVTGKDFDDGKFKNGDGLKDELGGCGKITHWRFSGNNDVGFTASCNLPFGTKACVGRAIVSAGGKDAGGCTGGG